MLCMVTYYRLSGLNAIVAALNMMSSPGWIECFQHSRRRAPRP
jgi:hypothetical protein